MKIKDGALINLKDNKGRTPLHCAAYKNAIESVRILCESKADINLKDNIGRTPLHCAA